MFQLSLVEKMSSKCARKGNFNPKFLNRPDPQCNFFYVVQSPVGIADSLDITSNSAAILYLARKSSQSSKFLRFGQSTFNL
ncbi:hypothetical protein ACFX2C_007640 [Malus domestica]